MPLGNKDTDMGVLQCVDWCGTRMITDIKYVYTTLKVFIIVHNNSLKTWSSYQITLQGWHTDGIKQNCDNYNLCYL